MTVYLVRHGAVRDPADFATALTAEGVEQAQRLAERLGDYSGTVYTSPFWRCRQTAHVIAAGRHLAIHDRPGLSEVGSFEDEHTVADVNRRAVQEYQALAEAGPDLLLVSHGGVIQPIARYLGHPTGDCERGQMIVISP